MNNIIAVSGKKRSGKDTFCRIASEYIKEKYNLDYENKKFADKLKQICSLMTGIPLEHWYDGNHYDDIIPLWNITIRQFMQKLGTECARNVLHPDSWIFALFAEYKKDDRWIITDLRFQNEALFLNNKGSIKIRVNRPGLKSDDTHQSEIDLDNYKNFDFIVSNDSTIEEFENKVKKIIDIIYLEEM